MRFPSQTNWVVGVICLVLAGCDVDVKDKGKLPDVDVSAEPGRLPDVDVRGPDVDVSVKEKEITVPDVDINSKTATIKVPDVDVDVPQENEEEVDASTEPENK